MKITLAQPHWYLKSGFRVDRLGPNSLGHSADTIVIEFGTCTDLFTGLEQYTMASGSGYLYVDPAVVGANGRDAASIWLPNSEICLWLIADDATNTLAGLLSASLGDYRNVTVPSGYHIVTLLPWAMLWKQWWPGSVGFADFHYAGEQNPTVVLTLGAQPSNKFCFFENFDGGIERNSYMPSIVPISVSRLVRVRTMMYAQGGSGAAWIGTASNYEIPLGTASPGQQYPGEATFRVKSDGSYWVRTSGGLKLDAWVMEYINTNTA